MLTASELRSNIYRLLDQVLETGKPIEVLRHGKVLRIVAKDDRDRLDRLPARDDYLNCDPEELIHIDWSSEWKP